jgi:ribosomal protein L6P/L9E
MSVGGDIYQEVEIEAGVSQMVKSQGPKSHLRSTFKESKELEVTIEDDDNIRAGFSLVHAQSGPRSIWV